MHVVLAPIRPGSPGTNHDTGNYLGSFNDRKAKPTRQVSFLGYQTSGKPPPESAPCILASEALKRVKQSPTNPALLITDGAPCYRSLSAKFGWWHEACNHSKGIFCIKKRMKNKRILIHAGGVDSMWRLLDQPFHVALRPGWTATSILNWCEAAGFGNGVGRTPKKMFWRKQVACCRSAWKSERGTKNGEFSAQKFL